MYFLTVDEISFVDQDIILLIESKHSKTALLPSISDIKDGLIKMILFTNLKEISVANENLNCKPILQLTSAKLTGLITTDSGQQEMEDFIELNEFTRKQIKLIGNLFIESKSNKFTIIIKRG
ncbi:MAG: hypothetical protein BWK79_05775 [Beggiatoa sp. IS2]|nr:MAG: hypothetical protein BWK79_05775 [Beggiatoa sp. IS2]